MYHYFLLHLGFKQINPNVLLKNACSVIKRIISVLKIKHISMRPKFKVSEFFCDLKDTIFSSKNRSYKLHRTPAVQWRENMQW